MKFKDLAVDTDFKFQGSNEVCRKLSQRKILTENGIASYFKNEEVTVADDTDVLVWIDFHSVPTNHYFRFAKDLNTVYKKVSAHGIRKLGERKAKIYRKNEKAEALGDDISQFIQPIIVSSQTVS